MTLGGLGLGVGVLATGSYLPEAVLGNDELAPLVGVEPAWIEAKTGILTRHVAADDAKFAMPEVKVGIPSVIHAALLPRLIGWGRARWLVMTAATVDAPTALAWGLVDVVAADGGLDAAVESVIDMLLDCAPQALRAQKALLKQWEELPLKESVDLSIGVFGQSYLTGEPQKLMQDFVSRKKKA